MILEGLVNDDAGDIFEDVDPCLLLVEAEADHGGEQLGIKLAFEQTGWHGWSHGGRPGGVDDGGGGGACIGARPRSGAPRRRRRGPVVGDGVCARWRVAPDLPIFPLAPAYGLGFMARRRRRRRRS